MGILTDEEALAQVAAAHAKYMTGATGMAVQTDLDARVALANTTHTAVTNAELDTELNSTTNSAGFESYSSGNVVTAVNDTVMGGLVRTALDADDLFTAGGHPTEDYVTSANVSDYVDSLWLIEASKQTGEKFF